MHQFSSGLGFSGVLSPKLQASQPEALYPNLSLESSLLCGRKNNKKNRRIMRTLQTRPGLSKALVSLRPLEGYKGLYNWGLGRETVVLGNGIYIEQPLMSGISSQLHLVFEFISPKSSGSRAPNMGPVFQLPSRPSRGPQIYL